MSATSGGFSFTSPATSSAPTPFAPSGVFNLVTTTTTTTAGTPSGGLFGTGSQQLGAAGGGLFGTSSAATGQLGGLASTSSGFTLGSAGTLFSTTSVPTSTAPNLFSGFGSTASSTPKQNFGLGPSTASSIPPLSGSLFGFGSNTTTTSSTTGFPFSLGQPTTTTASTFSGFGSFPSATGSLGSLAATAVTTTANIGLGGVDLSQSTPGLSGTGSFTGKGDNKAMKEIPVPNEIMTTVEAFKKYVKDQRNTREEITRMSSKPLYKVEEETIALKNLLSVVSNDIQRNVAIVDKLKSETAQELKNAEIGQRTKDTPLGLQYENVAPTEYFQHLVAIFENRMQLYRNKIEQMEKYLLSLSQSSLLTSQELTLVMKKIHETFISLAAQLQTIHERVKTQKEYYVTYRRVFCGDSTETTDSQPLISVKSYSSPKVSTIAGPTPFSGMSNAAAVAMASALNRTQQPTANGPPTLGLNNPSSVLGSSGMYSSSSLGAFSTSSGLGFAGFDAASGSSSYGSSGISGYSSAPSTPFLQKIQLQRPPPGNKRGKRVAHN